MPEKTVATFKQVSDDSVSILINTDHASSFYAFLREKSIPASPPTAAIFTRGRIYRDAAGILQVEEHAITHEIIAHGTLANAEGWIEEWLPSQN